MYKHKSLAFHSVGMPVEVSVRHNIHNSRIQTCAQYTLNFTIYRTAICGSTALVDLGRFFGFLIYTQSVGLHGRG
jgi:hypothetical protein